MLSLGCNVTILARDADKLALAREKLRSAAGGRGTISTLQADITDHAGINRILSDHVSIHGTPDIVIHSAGFSRPGLFVNLPAEQFVRMMNVNYFGAVHVTKALLPGMLARNSGHMVFISSVAGFLGMVGYTGYAASKFALRGFVDSLRIEIHPRQVRLSIVFPPDTETPALEAERPYQPPLLKAMNENAPPLSPEIVARSIVDGIKHNRYLITPGFDSTLYFKLAGLLSGGLMYPLIDIFLADARRKISRDPKKYGA